MLPLLSSVRGRIIAGFSLLVLMLVAVVAGSAWQQRVHQSAVAEMSEHAATSSLMQDARFQVALASLFVERYVITGSEQFVPLIRSSMATAQDSLAEALAQEQTRNDEDEISAVKEITAGAAFLSETFEQVIALRQSGDAEGARAVREAASPVRHQFGTELTTATEFEFSEVSALRRQVDRAADLAFWLLIGSGAIGIALGLAAALFIARSILRPLSSLESAALAVAGGDLEARAPATGPRELARLGVSLNRMTESLLDASKRRELEAERERAFAQLRESREQIKASLKEKEVLLREIHHRVKNNLQVISSLLNLQAESTSNKQALEMFKDSQSRVKSLALIHERLYRSSDLARIDFTEYIRALAADLFRSYGDDSGAITLKTNVDDVSLEIDTAIPCGLIINELVSNSLKHAFPGGKEGEVRIGLHSDNDHEITVIVGDNGVGLPKELDFRSTESLGLQLVCTLTAQLGGTIELDRSGGTEFKVAFTALQRVERE